ncbi:sensor histidine kinase [Streptomyces sp. NPDC060194]|uniref:sensor histidine kinase n=1 Tax=Streptomyces sp. NPDC060194 TaxID=3347069 RepID=UPI0036590865
MTETTHIPQQGPGRSRRSPEAQFVASATSGLREDLFRHAFAYRPLPRMVTDGPLASRLPAGLREYAAWTPHAVVVGLALFTLYVGAVAGDAYGLPAPFVPLLPPAAVLLTLIRPVAAWWLSLAATPVVALADSYGYNWPWPPAPLIGHLVVVTVVALRCRPRVAGWMWMLTLLYSVLAEGLGGTYGSSTTVVLFLSGVALLLTTVWHIRRDAQREVTAQRTVTAVERDRRTLLEERTTIARELHDVVAHHMSVVAIQAEAAPYRVENPPPELEQAFATIRENAVAALTELRRVLGVVRAEDYEAPDAPQPVLADLPHLLANVREAGLDVQLAVTGAVRELPQGVELSAYRIVQEALSNTLRHAPGAAARVELGYVLGGIGLRIVNDPIPPSTLVKPSPGSGHGITGMRERVAMLGGEMTAEPAPDGGYEVAVFLPVVRETLPGEGA